LDDEHFVWGKITSARPSGLEKIVGCHRILDEQTDSFSALYNMGKPHDACAHDSYYDLI